MNQFLAMFIIVGLALLVAVMVSQIQKAPNPCGGFAKIVLGAIINDIRGSIDADVYSVWKGTHYIRKKAASISNPNSIPQQLQRAALATLSQRWLAVLTPAQRALWNEYAQLRGSAAKENTSKAANALVPNIGRNLSGFNAYVGCNSILDRFGDAINDAAPVGVDLLPAPTVLAAAPDGPPVVNIVLTWTDPVGIAAGGFVEVWASCTAGAHKQIYARTANGNETYTITQLLGAGGVSIGLPNGLYRFQLAAYDSTGQRSAGSNVVEVNKTS